MSGEDRAVSFYLVLSSLMVAEERITTKFSGLVGAYGTEEEATFLSTQQVDEARHMQFYARFQDEVIADAGGDRRTCRARPRAASRRPSGSSSTRRSSQAHERLVAAPGDLDGQGRLRDALPPDPREHARAHVVQVHHRLPDREGLLPGFVEGYSKIHHDETRHIGYGVWFLREAVRERPELADVVRATLRDLLPPSPSR